MAAGFIVGGPKDGIFDYKEILIKERFPFDNVNIFIPQEKTLNEGLIVTAKINKNVCMLGEEITAKFLCDNKKGSKDVCTYKWKLIQYIDLVSRD